MKALTIRVEDEIFEKIESERGDVGRADYFRNLIESHFNEDDSLRIAEELNKIRVESDNIRNKLALSDSRISDLLNQIESHKSEIKTLEQQLAIQNDSHKEEIKILEKQLGFLQFEYQKLRGMNEQLLLPPSEKEIKQKKWWRFWQR